MSVFDDLGPRGPEEGSLRLLKKSWRTNAGKGIFMTFVSFGLPTDSASANAAAPGSTVPTRACVLQTDAWKGSLGNEGVDTDRKGKQEGKVRIERT